LKEATRKTKTKMGDNKRKICEVDDCGVEMMKLPQDRIKSLVLASPNTVDLVEYFYSTVTEI